MRNRILKNRSDEHSDCCSVAFHRYLRPKVDKGTNSNTDEHVCGAEVRSDLGDISALADKFLDVPTDLSQQLLSLDIQAAPPS